MMTSVVGVRESKLLGLFELNEAGTVLYSRLEKEGGGHREPAFDANGRNFYGEVVPFGNVGEFHTLLDDFMASSQQATSTTFACQYDDGPLLVRVLLARIREKSTDNATKSILVHIRKA